MALGAALALSLLSSVTQGRSPPYLSLRALQARVLGAALLQGKMSLIVLYHSVPTLMPILVVLPHTDSTLVQFVIILDRIQMFLKATKVPLEE